MHRFEVYNFSFPPFNVQSCAFIKKYKIDGEYTDGNLSGKNGPLQNCQV